MTNVYGTSISRPATRVGTEKMKIPSVDSLEVLTGHNSIDQTHKGPISGSKSRAQKKSDRRKVCKHIRSPKPIKKKIVVELLSCIINRKHVVCK